MKQKTETVLLVILNALAFLAGIWAALRFTTGVNVNSFNADLTLRVLFLAVLPAPLVFVWRYFRDVYSFRKTKFFLCTLVPPYIIAAVICAVLVVFMCTEGSMNGGYGGLAALGLMIALLVAQSCLMTSAVAWVSLEELFEKIKSDKIKRVLATVLLMICGALIFGGLHGLLRANPFAALYTTVDPSASHAASYALSIPIGFGASALMRVYRKEYSVKAPLFMLCSFLPTLLIAGVRLALIYFSDMKYYHYHTGFTDLLDTFIFTSAIAVMTAAVSALTAFIRGRRHYY